MLERVIKKNKMVFALTHNYSAYPMLREAKNLIDNDEKKNVKKFSR